MSLQQSILRRAYAGVPAQPKLFDPALLERWRAELQALLAAARQRHLAILSLLIVFFTLAMASFVYSLLRVTPASAAPTTPVSAVADRPLELHIAPNGLVLLRSAQITAIEGTTLTLGTTWGSTQFTWEVQTNAQKYEARHFGTKFLSRSGERISLRDLQVGQLVTVTGNLLANAQKPTIEAQTVRLSK